MIIDASVTATIMLHIKKKKKPFQILVVCNNNSLSAVTWLNPPGLLPDPTPGWGQVISTYVLPGPQISRAERQKLVCKCI